MISACSALSLACGGVGSPHNVVGVFGEAAVVLWRRQQPFGFNACLGRYLPVMTALFEIWFEFRTEIGSLATINSFCINHLK